MIALAMLVLAMLACSSRSSYCQDGLRVYVTYTIDADGNTSHANTYYSNEACQ